MYLNRLITDEQRLKFYKSQGMKFPETRMCGKTVTYCMELIAQALRRAQLRNEEWLYVGEMDEGIDTSRHAFSRVKLIVDKLELKGFEFNEKEKSFRCQVFEDRHFKYPEPEKETK